MQAYATRQAVNSLHGIIVEQGLRSYAQLTLVSAVAPEQRVAHAAAVSQEADAAARRAGQVFGDAAMLYAALSHDGHATTTGVSGGVVNEQAVFQPGLIMQQNRRSKPEPTLFEQPVMCEQTAPRNRIAAQGRPATSPCQIIKNPAILQHAIARQQRAAALARRAAALSQALTDAEAVYHRKLRKVLRAAVKHGSGAQGSCAKQAGIDKLPGLDQAVTV